MKNLLFITLLLSLVYCSRDSNSIETQNNSSGNTQTITYKTIRDTVTKDRFYPIVPTQTHLDFYSIQKPGFAAGLTIVNYQNYSTVRQSTSDYKYFIIDKQIKVTSRNNKYINGVMSSSAIVSEEFIMEGRFIFYGPSTTPPKTKIIKQLIEYTDNKINYYHIDEDGVKWWII